jgi:hypothetical protein
LKAKQHRHFYTSIWKLIYVSEPSILLHKATSSFVINITCNKKEQTHMLALPGFPVESIAEPKGDSSAG